MLTLRPPAGIALRRLVIGVLAGVTSVVTWDLQLHVLPGLFAAVAVVQLFRALRGAVGAVTVTDRGLRVRRLLGRRTLRWDDLVALAVRTTPFGSVTRAVLVRGGVTLPTPVAWWLHPDGTFERSLKELADLSAAHTSTLGPARRFAWSPRFAAPAIALAVFLGATMLDRPFGWIDGALASTLPDPCRTAAQGVAGILPYTEGTPADAGDERSCDWLLSGEQEVIVDVSRYLRTGLHGATGNAALGLRQVRAGFDDVSPVDGVGDEASMLVVHPVDPALTMIGAGTRTGAALLARRANVVVLVLVRGGIDNAFGAGGTPTQATTAAMRAAARSTLSALSLT